LSAAYRLADSAYQSEVVLGDVETAADSALIESCSGAGS
jgi:hypothetical protein